MSDYVIRITRRLPEFERIDGGRGNVHFYHIRLADGTLYEKVDDFDHANKFSEQEVKKITGEIECIYEKSEDVSGKLLKIEVINVETFKLVSMCEFNREFEPEVIISRFELMELW